MDQSKLISVIVPVYNIKEYLPRCVDSICNQTYFNLEIILVDDGSTDGTQEMCDQLAKRDSRIVVLHKENGGSSSARNMGIKAAKGEYLGFVDSDDYIGVMMYESLLKAMLEEQVSIAQAGRYEIAEDGSELPLVCVPPVIKTTYEAKDFMKELLLHKGDCSFCTKLIKKELFQYGIFPEGVLNEDFHLLVQFLEKKEKIVSIPEMMYYVFYKKESNTRTASKQYFSRIYSDNVDNADFVLELVQTTFPELTKIALRFGFYQRLDYMLHIPIREMDHKNEMYQAIKHNLRNHMIPIISSKYLSKKEKIYLIMLGTAPKTVRKVHHSKKKYAGNE